MKVMLLFSILQSRLVGFLEVSQNMTSHVFSTHCCRIACMLWTAKDVDL